MKELIIICTLLTVSSFTLNACSCFMSPFYVGYINSSDLFIKGKVVDKTTVKYIINSKGDTIQSFSANFQYKIKVTENIKPKFTEKLVTIYSPTQGSACGVNFKIGNEYYIFSKLKDGLNFTGLCLHNVRSKKASRKFKKIIKQFKNANNRYVWKNVEGRVIAVGKIVNEMPEGTWSYFHEDGKVKTSGNYKNGEKDGVWNSYLNLTASNAKMKTLDEEEKALIHNPTNIYFRQESYKDGWKYDSKLLFEF